MNNSEIIKKAESLLPEGSKLLCLVKFGSHLYGTNTENSDTDYKGIYQPPKKGLLTGKKFKTVNASTGNDDSKNTKEDIDIELWTIHYFLDLLRKGDMGAQDLYFSKTNTPLVIKLDWQMHDLFYNTKNLIDPKNITNIEYAVSQAKKYGLKGTRLNVLMKLDEYLQGLHWIDASSDRLIALAFDLIVRFQDEEFFSMKTLDNKGKPQDALYLLGKYYPLTVKASYFKEAVHKAAETYGHRAKQASKNEGIDWKAVSHSYRAIIQAKMLYRLGRVYFPLNEMHAQTLIEIKLGKMPWTDVEDLILTGIDELEAMEPQWKGSFDKEFVEDFIYQLYGGF